PELDLVTALVVGQPAGSPAAQDHPLRTELVIRFQQLCGAVMAKGIEDTAYYRWTQLTSLCEVGGAPERFAVEPEDLYRWAAHTQDHWPHTLTALSTHDAKRSEDVRARIGVLSQYPREWAALVHHLRTATAHERPAHLNGATENLLWQTLAGTWTAQGPPPADRFTDYLIKASREAKVWTGWTEPDQIGETALVDYARHLVDSEEVATTMAEWVTRTAGAVRAATLGARALQLMLPGVADTYQGTEVTTTSLVDRREAGEEPADLPAAKLQLSAALLRLRRRRPEVFVGPAAGFLPLATTSGAVVAFARTHDGEAQVVTLVTRRYRRLIEEGTDPDGLVHLPAGQWRSVLTSATYPGGPHALAQLLDSAPVEGLGGVNCGAPHRRRLRSRCGCGPPTPTRSSSWSTAARTPCAGTASGGYATNPLPTARTTDSCWTVRDRSRIRAARGNPAAYTSCPHISTRVSSRLPMPTGRAAMCANRSSTSCTWAPSPRPGRSGQPSPTCRIWWIWG